MLQKFFLRTGGADHAQGQAQLDALLENPPGKLLVELVGHGGTPPDAVLTYIDILKQARCPVAVTALGNLIGADFALWLVISPLRDICPNAWVFVPEQMAAPDGDGGSLQVQTVFSMVYETAYRRCLDLMAEYVDLAGILNRRLAPRELQEMYLLDCDHLGCLPGAFPDARENLSRGMEGGAR